MLQLSTISHTSVRYLLNVSYEQMYMRLSQVLSPKALSLFSEPNFGKSKSHWHTTIGKSAKSFDLCSDDEKDVIADLLREKKEIVEQELSNIPELNTYTSTIFDVPESNNIHAVRLENGEIDVVLSLWGCKKNRDYSGSGVVGTILNRPKSDHTSVEVLIKYSDGTLSNDRDYYFKYKNRSPLKFRANDEGIKVFGQLKNGSSFCISATEEPDNTDQEFTVIEGQELYVANFPYFANAVVRVKNQLGELVSGYTLDVEASNKSQKCQTNEDGEILIENILLDEQSLKLSSENNKTEEFPLGKSGNEFVYQIEERILRQPHIKVIDKEGDLVNNYPLIVNYKGEQKSISTDEDGVAKLEELDLEQEIEVVDGNNEYNNQKYIIETEDNVFVFEVDPPKAKEITIRILDHKKNPLHENALDVKIGEQSFQRQTNEKGEVYFSDSLFENNKKFEVGIHIPNKENKVKKKKIKYKQGKDIYTLRLKKFNRLWLLLLLLPLLLLLKFEKDVYVKTVSPKGKPVANAITTLHHNESFIFDNNEFFVSKDLTKKDTADIRGILGFKKLRYSVYSFIFKSKIMALIHSESECYISDTISKNYHLLSLFKTDTIVINTKPKLGDIKYRVIEEDTDSPISNAILYYQRELEGELVKDSVRTNANGEAILKELPICGEINWLKSEANGYKDYEEEKISSKEVLENSDLAVCPMEPLRERIEFFVTNCETAEPLPDASATITIIDKDGREEQKAITNIDGLGRGSYDEVKVLSKIQIDVERKYFKPGRLDKVYTVQEFIELPDSLRTICLEPKPNSMDFIVIDSISKRPIAGALNIVKIIKPNEVLIDTIMSNRNGSFTVSEIKLGDKISIISSKDPEYHPNDKKIVEADAIDLLEGSSSSRTIPLHPKLMKFKFTTIDRIDRTIVPRVNLDITINNRGFSAVNRSDQNGEFVLNLRYNDEVSIRASKKGYLTNSSQIRRVKARHLVQEEKRKVLMSIPPCTNKSLSNADKGMSINEYDMRQNGGSFDFIYFTDTVKDEIIVYDGRKNDPNKRIIFRYNDATDYSTFTERLNFRTRFVTVEVIGNTNWRYTVKCPN